LIRASKLSLRAAGQLVQVDALDASCWSQTQVVGLLIRAARLKFQAADQLVRADARNASSWSSDASC